MLEPQRSSGGMCLHRPHYGYVYARHHLRLHRVLRGRGGHSERERQELSTRHTSRQIQRLLLVEVEKLQKGGPRYDAEYVQRERGGSRPPLNASGETFLDQGIEFTDREKKPLPEWRQRACRSTLSALRHDLDRYPLPGGHTLYSIVSLLRSEPGSVRWMESGESKDAESLRNAFDVGCWMIASGFEQIYPDVEIRVNVDASEELVGSKREAGYLDRKSKTRRESEALVMTWTKIKTERGVGSEEAKRIMEQERGISCKRVERAITEANRGEVAS